MNMILNSFEAETQGVYNIGITKDLFIDGIFAIDGDKWRHKALV
jgi:hypothetical protein